QPAGQGAQARTAPAACRRGGSGMTKPVLLLVPGMLNDASVWDEVAAPLQPLAVVRVATPEQASIAAMAQAAWARLDGVPRDRPVVLAGFSLGGYVVIEMRARRARPVHAAALLSTSARP